MKAEDPTGPSLSQETEYPHYSPEPTVTHFFGPRFAVPPLVSSCRLVSPQSFSSEGAGSQCQAMAAVG